MKVMTCFACGKSIQSTSIPCPHCGYQFTAGDDRYCPNMNFGLCSITEIPCTYGIMWHKCPSKTKADNESEF